MDEFRGAGLTLLISHQDQVTTLPAKRHGNLQRILPVAAYHILKSQVLCFQGHPEFVHDYSRGLLGNTSDNLGEKGLQQAWPAWNATTTASPWRNG